MLLRPLLVWLALAVAAAAGPDRLSVLLGSHHVGGSGFDGRNPGLFLTWEERGPGFDLTLGAYRNSYGRGSVVATAALPVLRWREGALSLFAGAAWYPGNGRNFRVQVGDLVPIGGVQIRHRNVFVQILPSDGRHTRAVIAGGITYQIK